MKQNFLQNIRTGLTLEEVTATLPSVGKEERWGGGRLTDKYTVISTLNLLRAVGEIGYVPTFATQSRSRIDGKEEYTKHYIRLAHRDSLGWKLGEEFFEIALVNSFDGSSSYVLHQAVTRLACLNGLVVSNDFSTIHVPHKGNIVDAVVKGTVELASSSEGVLEDVRAMKNTRLSEEQALSLASEIVRVRFGETTLFEPKDLLRKDAIRRRDWRRSNDYQGENLWEYMNLIEENAIRGGMYRYDSRGDRRTARQVAGIDQSFKINRAVWSEAKALLN